MATCPYCATPVVPGANFCHVCGRPLAEPGLNPAQARPGRAIAGASLAPAQPDQPGSAGRSAPSERRIVTILFCDVKGSTELAESLDPEEWAEVMNGAFEHLIKPVYRYGGTVARLMGDAVLALFGAPIAHEDDPQRAVRAGLDIIAGIRAYRERIRQERGLEFDVRVGINTGWVVVGEVGTDLRAEYTAMGDAANLAARMEQTARPGSVQISADTYKLVAPLFEVEALGSLELKGKREAVPAYRVLGLKTIPSLLRGPDGPETPLVGRQAEMATLRRVLSDVRGVGSQIVCLIGEEGLGKSRLIHELRTAWFAREEQQEALRAALRRQTGSRLHSWIDGRCLSHEVLHPYGQFQYLIRFVCGATESDAPDIVREKIARLAEAVSPEQSARLSQVFEALLSIDTNPGATPLEGEGMKRRLFEVVTEILRAWAAIGPGVLAFDDMHWCDPASVDLLLRLIQVAGDLPVLFLCAFRPDPHSPAWRIKQTAQTDWPQRYTELTLHPLPSEDADALIQILLPPADLPHELRQRIRHKTEGNPFFVEEVVRGLIEQGALARSEPDGAPDRRSAASIAEVAIPDNVQALLVARMDRLPEEVRRTLQLAAVIGRSFSYRVLQLIAGAQPGLGEQLAALTADDLIRESAPRPELEYTFRSALTQEAAYKSMLLRRRREIHLRVGETLETLYANRLEEQASLLAHHFDLAGDSRAPTYHSLAGDAALRLHALSEAEAHYARALELSQADDSHPLRLKHLVIQRGRTLELLGRYDEAIHNYEALEAIAHNRGDRALELAALIARTTVHSRLTAKYDPARGLVLATRAVALARELGDAPAEARILWNLSVLNTFSGQLQAGLDYGEQSLAIARQLDLSEQVAHTLNDLSHVYLLTGQRERFGAALRDAADIWRALGDLPMLAENLANTATGHFFYGEYAQALNQAADALRISQSIDNVWGQAYSREIAGLVYLEWGQADEAIGAFQMAIELGERAGFLDALVSARTYLGLILAYLGDVARAFPLVSRAVAQSEEAPYLRAMPLAILGFLHILQNDLDRAEALVRDAYLSLDRSVSISPAPIWVTFVDAELALARADHARVDEMMDGLLSQLRILQAQPFILNALRLKGQALARSGRTSEARAVLQDARELADALGSRRALWPVLTTLCQLEAQAGDLNAAGDLRQRARRTIHYIADQISEPELRASFVSLPDVRSITSAGSAPGEERSIGTG